MNQPKQISTPWAKEGLKNNIPSRRDVGLSQESATYQEGFPSITMTPISVGGKPPSGRDMNGILYELSSHIAFTNQGKHYKFNQEFCDEINGYPKGAILINNQETALYISLTEQNKVNFNTSSSENWKVLADINLLAEIGKKATQADFTALKNLLVGIPFPYPLAEVPEGCLAFNGQTFSTSLYPELAKKYPTGRLPDLRGEFIRGWDNGREVDSGRLLLSIQGDAIAQHYHGQKTSGGSFVTWGEHIPVGTTIYEVSDYLKGNTSDNNRAYIPTNTDSAGKAIWDGNKFVFSALTTEGVAMRENEWGSDDRVQPESRPRNIAYQYICLAA